MLQSMGLQRVGHNRVTELTEHETLFLLSGGNGCPEGVRNMS